MESAKKHFRRRSSIKLDCSSDGDGGGGSSSGGGGSGDQVDFVDLQCALGYDIRSGTPRDLNYYVPMDSRSPVQRGRAQSLSMPVSSALVGMKYSSCGGGGGGDPNRRHTVAIDGSQILDENTARALLLELEAAQNEVRRLVNKQWGGSNVDGVDDEESASPNQQFVRPGRRQGREGETFCMNDQNQDGHWMQHIRKNAMAIFDPRGMWRSRWNILIIVLLVYNLVDIPLRLCFDVYNEPWTPLDVIDLCVDLMFLTDVVLNFRTGFYEHGFFVSDPKLIRQRYVRGWFTFDLVTSIPLTHIVNVARKLNDRTRLVREVIRSVAGHAPYERRIMELLKGGGTNPQKRAWRFAKKRLGTHRRAKRKVAEMSNTISNQQQKK